MIKTYVHHIQYYETDKMGVTHHSNYIRWMEEARGNFLSQIGWDYDRLEKEGVFSPVVSIDCRFVKPTTYSEKISIKLNIKECKGAKLIAGYVMENESGEIVFTGTSSHAFVYRDGRLIRLKRDYRELFDIFSSMIDEYEKEEQV